MKRIIALLLLLSLLLAGCGGGSDTTEPPADTEGTEPEVTEMEEALLARISASVAPVATY